MKRSFQGLFIAIKTMRIIEELMERWPNEVCDNLSFLLGFLLDNPVSGPSFVPTVIAALHPSNKVNNHSI